MPNYKAMCELFYQALLESLEELSAVKALYEASRQQYGDEANYASLYGDLFAAAADVRGDLNEACQAAIAVYLADPEPTQFLLSDGAVLTVPEDPTKEDLDRIRAILHDRSRPNPIKQ